MSSYPLSTGEAVQHVLEGRECESEGNWRMRLIGAEPRIATSTTNSSVGAAHRYIRWRLVPVLVNREEALRALAAGKAIKRRDARFSTHLGSGTIRFDDAARGPFISAGAFADMFLDDSACWEILP